MSGEEHPVEWYLARDDQQFGPLSDVELKKFIELGHMRGTDLLWRHGFPDWRPASSVFPSVRGSAPASGGGHQPQAQSHPQPEPQPQPQPQAQQHAPRQAPLGDPNLAVADMNAAAASDGPATAAPAAVRPVQAARPARGHQHHPAAGAGQRPNRPGADAAAVRSGPGRPARKPAPTGRRRFPWLTVIVCLLLAALAGTALALHRSGTLNALMADFGLSDMADATANATATGSSTGSTTIATSSSDISRAAASASPPPPVSGAVSQDSLKASPLQGLGTSSEEVDAGFQRSALWRLLKKEFPDWYAERVQQTVTLRGEQKDDKAVAQALAEAMVALRRKHVGDALAASPSRLRQLAASFLENLGRLASSSVEACYGFISQGETSPLVVELMRSSPHTANLQAQVVAVFESIVEGRNAPRSNVAPRREDYDMLAAQLAKRGWSPADLQLFSDARALSRAPPQKVCQMVQDWFAAQLAVKDEEVQLRLLVEALKPVVAG